MPLKRTKAVEAMIKRQKEQEIIKAYNKSPQGKKLMDLVRKKHDQERVDLERLPF